MSAQLEDGYARIANEILEEIPKYKLNGTQFSLLMVVWRYTYGFNRKDHEMSLSFFQEATCICRSQIDRELTNLINLKVVIVTKESDHVQSRRLGFNKRFEEWGCQLKRGQSAKKRTVSELEDTVSAKTGTVGVRELEDQEIHSFKDNLKDITAATENLTISDIYTKVFRTLNMNGLMSEYIMHLKAEGMSEHTIKELMIETGESANTGGASIKLMKTIGARWLKDGVKDRDQARNDKQKEGEQVEKHWGGAQGVRPGSYPKASGDDTSILRGRTGWIGNSKYKNIATDMSDLQ